MKILSVFITSNNVNLLLNIDGKFKNEAFPFYPYFQSKEDLEYLITSYIKSLALRIDDLTILPISTAFDFPVFGKKVNFLSNELLNKKDFLYIYFDNLSLYSQKNISLTSLGLSTRSDNFISNRSVFSANKFTGDVEEIIYLSKSINDSYRTELKKVVLGGDYFTNTEIPNEFKLNLISEILERGFYEIYIDSENSYPNFLNLRNNSSIAIKSLDFEKFCYLISSIKSTELLFEQNNTQKYLHMKLNETYFLNFNQSESLKLKYKGKDIGNNELLIDSDFSGLFVDLRDTFEKKKNLGVESFRKVLASIEKNNDYTSL